MKIPFLRKSAAAPGHVAAQESVRPEPTVVPDLKTCFIAALYRGARTGGDFYDVVVIPETDRVVFLLLDIAGKREHALRIAAEVQQVFRRFAYSNFKEIGINLADELTSLSLRLNRSVIDSVGGAHFCPAFLGSYNQQLGILCYVNAGHTPALVKDSGSITLLKASGLPLGLFSHSTHDAQMAVLEPGAALVLVSRGIVECRRKSKEYGMERAIAVLDNMTFDDAQQICAALLADAQRYAGDRPPENDWTTLVLVRAKAARIAIVGV